MGMLDDVGGALDKVSSALGGAAGPAPAPKPPTPPAQFCQCIPVGAEQQVRPGAFAPVDDGVVDGPAKIEFIHFGHVHTDGSDKFAQEADVQDDKPLDAKEAAAGHGVRFRAALQREALLVGGFVAQTQAALEDWKKSQGGAGGALAAVGSLMSAFGGGGGGPSGPDPSDLNDYADAVKKAVDPIGDKPVEYPKLHKAGIDLQQARSDYGDYRDKLLQKADDKKKADEASSPMGAITSATSSALGAIGGAGGDVVKLIQGMAFKAFDIYLHFYVGIAKALEPTIAEAARELSIDALRKQTTPIFSAWGAKPPAKDTSSGGTGIGAVDDAITDAKKEVQKLQDFFAAPPKPVPGSRFVDHVFGQMTPGPQVNKDGSAPEPPPAPAADGPSVPDAVVSSFEDALGIKPLPGFVETLVREVLKVNVEFLQGVYVRLVSRDPATALDEQELYEAARLHLLQKLVGILVGLCDTIKDAKEFSAGIQGMSITPGNLIDQAVEKLNKEAGGKLDPVLHLTMGALVDRLEGVRQQVTKEKAFSMEAYLGLLPGALALNFRNTFFPVWDLLIDNTFGKLGFLGDIVKAASSALKDVQSKVDEGRDYATRAKAIKDRWDRDGLQAGTGPSNVNDFIADSNKDADRGSAPPPKPAVIKTFPLPSRKNTVSAKKIEEADVKKVEPDEKFEKATPECPRKSLHTLTA